MKWNFRQGGKTENPKDAGIKEFSKHIFESVVREATQNALDNRLNNKLPVKIEFKFGKISRRSIPGYDELVERWNACYKKWEHTEQYKELLQNIKNRISEFNTELPYLSISDYNTNGMDFTSNEDIDKTRYGAFSRGTHSFHSSDNAAGSEGQGKAALYAISAIRTMFVHTISNKGEIYEGLTRFATHEYNNQKYNADGYFFHKPDSLKYGRIDGFPNELTRSDNSFGTTISLIGLWKYESVEEKMIKAAINNFWMAILDGDLIIKVNTTTLDSSNIEELILRYLPDRSESNRTKSNPTDYGRALCYYETWREKNEFTETYETTLKSIGACKLKISQHDEYPGKIAFFRIQKMLILRSPVGAYVSKGYCGVFICTDENGNKLLRKMEGKTHTEWDPNFCVTADQVSAGKKAIEEINHFILESWNDYRKKHFPDSIDMKGLAGITLKKNGKKNNEKIDKEKKEPKKKEPTNKPKITHSKIGVILNQFSSFRRDDKWYYKLILKSNSDKNVKITMLPATDSLKLTDNELVDVNYVSKPWKFKNNSIIGTLKQNYNDIEFSLNSTERIAIDFKISLNEN